MSSGSVMADQALFGWVDWKGRSGYQFITSSCELLEPDFKFLSQNSLPENYSILKIKECRRLFLLPSGKIVINYVKDIGKDAHGRDGALMSHFLIIQPSSFGVVKADLNISDIHHLRGIASLNDLRKLILPDGNVVKLPQVIMDIPEQQHFLINKFLLEEGQEFISDLMYGVFLNIFDSNIIINLIGKSENDVFQNMAVIESLFPSWLILPYSTHRYESEDMEPFIVMRYRSSASLGPDEVIIDFGSSSVSVPGEDKFIRMVSSEYISMILKDSSFEKLNQSYREHKLEEPKFSLIQSVILSICRGPDREKAMQTAIMVSTMGIYGKMEMYQNVIKDILVGSHYQPELVTMLIDEVRKTEENNWEEGGQEYTYIKMLLEADPETDSGKSVLQFMNSLVKGKNSQFMFSLFSIVMDDSVSPEMASSVIEIIPNVQKLYATYMESHGVTEELLRRSVRIFGEFREMSDNLLRSFETLLTSNNGADQATIVNVLKLLQENMKLFDSKKIGKLLRNLQKTIKKQKVPLRSDIEDTIGQLKDMGDMGSDD